MGEISLFGIREDRALAFGERVRGVLARRDTAGWRALLESFTSAYRPPYLTSDGRFIVDVHPLADAAWHRPPDDARVPLSADVVPAVDSPDVAWILSYTLLMTSDVRVCLDASHFAYGWTDEIPDRGLLESSAEQEAHTRIRDALFEQPGPVPAALWFLPPTVSGPHAYLSPASVKDIVQLEAEVGVMKRLAGRLQAEAESEYQWFGRDIAKLSHCLALASLSQQAVFATYFAL